MPSAQRSRHVVLVVGNTGSGVSSTISLIAGFPGKNSSPDAQRRTRKAKLYSTEIDHTDINGVVSRNRSHPISLYEVPGFDGSGHDVQLLKYIRYLHKSVGIDLVLYCIRHPRRFLPDTSRSLREALQDVRFAAIVTGLEMERRPMQGWWTRRSEQGADGSNGAALQRVLRVSFDDHACVTTLSEKDTALNPRLQKLRKESQLQLWALISMHCSEHEKALGSGIPCERYMAALNIRTAASLH